MYGQMIRALFKLLALVAVLVMPFGMAAPAAAAHHEAAAAMPMEHCPDAQKQTDTSEGFAQCTMACAAALADLGQAADGRVTIVCAAPAASSPSILHGILQDIATPPPKRS